MNYHQRDSSPPLKKKGNILIEPINENTIIQVQKIPGPTLTGECNLQPVAEISRSKSEGNFTSYEELGCSAGNSNDVLVEFVDGTNSADKSTTIPRGTPNFDKSQKADFKICKYTTTSPEVSVITNSSFEISIPTTENKNNILLEKTIQPIMRKNSGTKFKIVKIESEKRFKKDRWDVWEYYDGTIAADLEPAALYEGRAKDQQRQNQQRSSPRERQYARKTQAIQTQKHSPIDENNHGNNDKNRSGIQLSGLPPLPRNHTTQKTNVPANHTKNITNLVDSRKISTHEMMIQQFGLEKSLSIEVAGGRPIFIGGVAAGKSALEEGANPKIMAVESSEEEDMKQRSHAQSRFQISSSNCHSSGSEELQQADDRFCPSEGQTTRPVHRADSFQKSNDLLSTPLDLQRRHSMVPNAIAISNNNLRQKESHNSVSQNSLLVQQQPDVSYHNPKIDETTHAKQTKNNRFGNSRTPSQNSQQLFDIDRKIEQAMDLVKTHLLFAVREEVEILQSRMLELESTVFRLELENSILREHVPSEVLNNLDVFRTSIAH